MGFSLKIQECEDCQRLLKKYDYDGVTECERCGHLYNKNGECSCLR